MATEDDSDSPGHLIRPFKKRRRVGLACRSCRRRKSRCDGGRPICSTCHDLGHKCIYEPPSATPETPASAKKRLKTSEGSPRVAGQDEAVPSDEEDVAVDALAPEALGDALEPNIGHFGPTSNHALFRFLSGIFAQQAQQMVLPHVSVSGDVQQALHVETRPASPKSMRDEYRQGSRAKQDKGGPYVLPTDSALSTLVNRFFATVGAVFPVVNRPVLPSSQGKPLSRSAKALLNMLCAHAAASTSSGQAETFYRRALELLDERTMRGSTLELVQSLFLICLFQQNHQRSIASWTYHAMTVRSAYQLGIHAPTAYHDHGSQEREVRRRLWYAIVNQDRYLNISLGRPCLIPTQYVSLTRLESVPRAPPYGREYADNIKYFDYLTRLYGIQGFAVDQLYDHNVETTDDPSMTDKLASRVRLLIDLERWRDEVAPVLGSIPITDHESWTSSKYDANRYRVLLSLQYYSTRLVLNAPILTAFLKARASRPTNAETDALVDSAVPVIGNDFLAASSFEKLISGLSTAAPRFLDSNGAWWTCNFHMFTINLHLFGVLLACQRQAAAPHVHAVTDIEAREALTRGVKTLHAVERTSHMSRKARHCLQSFLQVYDSLTLGQPGPTNATLAAVTDQQSLQTPLFSNDLLSDTYFAQWISQSADDFLLHTSQYDILDTDMGFFQP